MKSTFHIILWGTKGCRCLFFPCYCCKLISLGRNVCFELENWISKKKNVKRKEKLCKKVTFVMLDSGVYLEVRSFNPAQLSKGMWQNFHSKPINIDTIIVAYQTKLILIKNHTKISILIHKSLCRRRWKEEILINKEWVRVKKHKASGYSSSINKRLSYTRHKLKIHVKALVLCDCCRERERESSERSFQCLSLECMSEEY